MDRVENNNSKEKTWESSAGETLYTWLQSTSTRVECYKAVLED
jgi:hypothetical protein